MKVHSRSILILFVLALVAVTTSAQPGMAQSGTLSTVISVDPSDLNLLVGEETTLAIRIRDVVGLRGYSVVMNFDPGAVEILELANGGFLENGWVEPYSGFDNDAGTIRYGYAITYPELPRSGSGILFTIRLQAVAPATAVHFTILIGPEQTALVGEDYFPIDFTVENGVIHIPGGATHRNIYLPSILK